MSSDCNCNPSNSGRLNEQITTPTPRETGSAKTLYPCNEFYNDVLNLIPQAVRIIDREFNVRFINHAFTEMFGIESQRVMGMKCWEAFTGPFCHTPNCRFQRILSGSEIVKDEIERLKTDGTTIPCSVCANAIHTASGELIGIVESFWDITERKHLETEVQETRNLYSTLIELGSKAGEAVIMLQDVDGREAIHTFVSNSWSLITGYPPDELYGMSLIDIVKTADRAVCLERYRRKMAGEHIPGLFDITIVRKDGMEIPIKVTGTVVTKRGKRVNVLYIWDNTEHVQLERSLKESEALYRTIFNTTGTATFIMDSEAKPSLVNQEFTKLFGYTNEEAITKTGRQLTVEDKHPQMSTRFKHRKVGITPVSDRYETQIITKDGVVKDVDMTVCMIPNTLNRVVSIVDISERKQHMQELFRLNTHLQHAVEHATHDLREANEALKEIIQKYKITEKTLADSLESERLLRIKVESQMEQKVQYVRALVHELRTPLTALLAASDLMVDSAESELSKKTVKAD